MDNDLQQGIAAAKAGNTIQAFDFLTRASHNPANAEQAWLWLSSVVGDDAERLYCLDSVLKINPDHKAAQRGALSLRQKGIFPAIPVYPEPQRSASLQEFTFTSKSSASSSKMNVAGSAQNAQVGSALKTNWNKPDASGLFQYAAMELSNYKPRKEIEKELVSRGASPKEAKKIVADARYALKKGHRDKYKKRMTRGLIWTVLGVIITCGTFAFADQLGGKFYLFYGAIILGFIDFMIGLIGWLTNS